MSGIDRLKNALRTAHADLQRYRESGEYGAAAECEEFITILESDIEWLERAER